MEVDWSAYAKQYDLMAQINPAYQELVGHCVSTVEKWQLKQGAVIADLCAGTGNFSLAIARALPHLVVLHVELNPSMLSLANAKARSVGLSNWRASQVDLQSEVWNLPKLDGVVAVHCIYALKEPRSFISTLCSQLASGGFVYACDVGRVFRLLDWACFLFARSLAARGFWATLALLPNTNLIRRQNRLIAKAQRAGRFWTHELGEFRACFEQSGISILQASDKMYRGYDDLIIGTKRQ